MPRNTYTKTELNQKPSTSCSRLEKLKPNYLFSSRTPPHDLHLPRLQTPALPNQPTSLTAPNSKLHLYGSANTTSSPVPKPI
ncbi:hypothetical protein KC19_4G205600, partial [Ceratodon purpureus]